MSGGPIDPGLQGIAVSAALMAIMLLLARLQGHDSLRKGVWAAMRATVQLLAVGLVLNHIFTREQDLAVLGILALMTIIAGFTAASQVEQRVGRSALVMILGLGSVSALLLGASLHLALGIHSLEARYVVPLGGILLGNAMTATTLAANHYLRYLVEQRGLMETALSLGASPKQADQRARSAAFATAVTPVLNAMMVVGVVKLPGIMSGQLLGGSSPLISAKYQLVVLFLLAAGDGLSALWVLAWLRRRAFNRAWQLVTLD